MGDACARELIRKRLLLDVFRKCFSPKCGSKRDARCLPLLSFLSLGFNNTEPNDPATFVKRLPNVFQTSTLYNDYPTCSKRHGRLEHVGKSLY